MLRIFLLCFVSVFACGCSMGGLVRVSDPSISEKSAILFSDGIMHFEGVSISVRPENYGLRVVTVGPFIFPLIPIDFPKQYEREGLPFRIIVQFETVNEHLIFEPSSTILTVDG